MYNHYFDVFLSKIPAKALKLALGQTNYSDELSNHKEKSRRMGGKKIKCVGKTFMDEPL